MCLGNIGMRSTSCRGGEHKNDEKRARLKIGD
jgi:hypothetical protein